MIREVVGGIDRVARCEGRQGEMLQVGVRAAMWAGSVDAMGGGTAGDRGLHRI
jgi:hypothetical protein